MVQYFIWMFFGKKDMLYYGCSLQRFYFGINCKSDIMFVGWEACIPITCPVDICGMQGIIHMVKRWKQCDYNGDGSGLVNHCQWTSPMEFYWTQVSGDIYFVGTSVWWFSWNQTNLCKVIICTDITDLSVQEIKGELRMDSCKAELRIK